jgi:multiple sugar transport system permease protein
MTTTPSLAEKTSPTSPAHPHNRKPGRRPKGAQVRGRRREAIGLVMPSLIPAF